jgi:hypothetical protein
VNRYEFATNSSSYLNSVKVTVLDLAQILNRNPEKVGMAQDPVPPQIKNPMRVVLDLDRTRIQNPARVALDPT